MTFRENRLNELCEIVSSKRVFAESYQSSGIPFYRGKEVSQLARGENTTAELYISEEVYKDVISRTGPINSGDILLTAVGTLGNPYQVKETDLPFYFKDGNIVWLRKFSKDMDSTFLFYWLDSDYGRRKVLDTSIGSTQAALTIKGLGAISISYPSISQQTEIVRILSAIDRKIAINRALAKTLENIAQTIFKSWFIDFDPVKAKLAGVNPAGMDAATAALFPDSMEESQIGPIPQSWSWGNVGDIASVIDCLHSKKPELLEEGHPYLQLDTVSDSGVLRFENAGFISKEDYDKWTSRIEVRGGDCLITNVGRVGAVSQVPEHFKAAIGRNITAIRPKDSKLHKSYLVIALLSDFMKKEIRKNTDSGTILEALNVKNIPKLSIPIPSEGVFKRFAQLCDPIQLQVQELHAMSVNLKEIRDSLLPRLISGELQIPDEMLAS